MGFLWWHFPCLETSTLMQRKSFILVLAYLCITELLMCIKWLKRLKLLSLNQGIFSFFWSSIKLACSRLRDGGGKSFSEMKCEKCEGAGERQGGVPFFPPPPPPFPSRARLIFALLVLIRFHYTIWEPGTGYHKVRHECKAKRAFETREKGTSRKMKANRKKGMQFIVGCHSRDQLLCKFLETFFTCEKRSMRVFFCTPTWPSFNCFVHRYGRREVMWKPSIAATKKLRILMISIDYNDRPFRVIIYRQSKVRPNTPTCVFCSYRHFTCVRPTVELSELINASWKVWTQKSFHK